MTTAPIQVPYSINEPGGITQWIGNPTVGVGRRPVELITTVYPAFNVFCGGVTVARGISLPNLF